MEFNEAVAFQKANDKINSDPLLKEAKEKYVKNKRTVQTVQSYKKKRKI